MTSEKTVLHSIEVEPQNSATHTIIWLHGLGADGNDFVPIVAELNHIVKKNIRFVFPHAPIMPVTINNGYEMRAWYDIYSLTDNHRVDKNGIDRSVSLINELIQAEINRGIAPNHIILAGFSQGAALAMTTSVRYPETLAGVIALSGYLPLGQETFHKKNQANIHTPFFLAHGTEDSVVPFVAGLAANSLLTQAGYNVAWHSYRMPHSVCAEETTDIGHWIANQLNK